MFKRWFLLFALGAFATLGAVTGADAGCCGTGCGGCGDYAAPMVQQQYAQNYYPVAHACCGQQTYASPCGYGPPFLGHLLDPTDDHSCAPFHPVPAYIVNQGPVYSGPNFAVAPVPYPYSYGNTQPYPYVPSYYSGFYSGGPYADPIQHRVYHYSRIYQYHAYRGGPRVLHR